MRICIDIDGTICHLRKPFETYKDLKPIEGAVDKLKNFRSQGHYIILHTARHMKTCQGNIGQVIARQSHTLTDWLSKHGFEYDELWFGKPHADIYIDDKAYKFQNWDSIDEELIQTYLEPV